MSLVTRLLRPVAAGLCGLILLGGAGLAAAQQPAPTHEVRRGDTLFGIARKAKHEGVSRNQMIMAIFRANPGAFPGGNPNLLEVGTVLNIPSRENVLSLSAFDADRQVRDLIIPRTAASAPGSQVAVARPSTGGASPTEKPAGVAPGQEAAAKRYQDGLAMERSGDHRGALQAFLEAGNAGFGLAQRRLGQIYDMGSPAVSRDYQLSLLWYQKARDQGLDVGKQIQRLTPK